MGLLLFTPPELQDHIIASVFTRIHQLKDIYLSKGKKENYKINKVKIKGKSIFSCKLSSGVLNLFFYSLSYMKP
jgi:hypothetical protein